MRTQHGYRKRVKHVDMPGQAHYLTFSCFHNQKFLNDNRTRMWFINALEKARQKHGFELWAWVIMPEHIHLMLLPRAGTSISSILTSVKTSVARLGSNWARKEDPELLQRMLDIQCDKKQPVRFWQRGGGYDRNICSEEEVYEKIIYMHKNPVRKGMVEHPKDWYWSSLRAYEYNDIDPIAVDRESLPPMKVI